MRSRVNPSGTKAMHSPPAAATEVMELPFSTPIIREDIKRQRNGPYQSESS